MKFRGAGFRGEVWERIWLVLLDWTIYVQRSSRVRHCPPRPALELLDTAILENSFQCGASSLGLIKEKCTRNLQLSAGTLNLPYPLIRFVIFVFKFNS